MMREFRFLLKDRAAILWLVLAFFVALSAVMMGTIEINQQRAEIAALTDLDQAERASVLADQSDWGSAAYYTFHLTVDEPSNFAYAALGQRDVSPWKHRVRMLALEGQIYETDAANPDFALIGRFDFAFVIALLGPLFVVLLLFDLRSGERAAGRYELIDASGSKLGAVWRTRSMLRIGLLATAFILPLWIGGILSETVPLTLVYASFATVAYLIFWGLIGFFGATAERTGSVNLTVLLGIWLIICAIIPTLLTQVIERAVPLPDGGDIILTQREAVNDAWDLPKEATYTPFLERHPEWSDYTSWDSTDFEWKWYYAFQQVGDQTAEPLSLAYRKGRAQRDNLTTWASILSPATAVQRVFERLADTDMSAALRYEQSVRDYHADLRAWYYPRLFEQREFSQDDAVAGLPEFLKDMAQE